MNDLLSLLPHAKKESKVEKHFQISALIELAEMHSCSSLLYIESRKRFNFLWMAACPEGPSIKFLLQNVHTSQELKLTGNCVKFSRPLLTFGPEFTAEPHLQMLQQLLTQTFATPRYHPKSKAFHDHSIHFAMADGKVWVRHYELVKQPDDVALVEIGPRFVLTPVKMLAGVLSGKSFYTDSVALPRKRVKQTYAEKQLQIARKEARTVELPKDELDNREVFG
jgi:ribosome biogenesis protein BRX1